MAKQQILLGGIVKEEVKKANDNFDELYQLAETIPSATSDLTNDSNFVTSSDVSQAISAATGDFPTETEMAQAITQATANMATDNELATGLGGKVDKEQGKGLSSNDYATTDKNKVANLGKIDFTASDFGSAQTDGYFYATLSAAGKYPVKVMKSNGSNYDEVIVQTSVEGNNIVLCSSAAFAGYVVTI